MFGTILYDEFTDEKFMLFDEVVENENQLGLIKLR
jgi:hypothetical protein